MRRPGKRPRPSKKLASPLQATARASENGRTTKVATDLVPMSRTSGTGVLALEIGRMIASARQQVAQTANEALTTLYWQIGALIPMKDPLKRDFYAEMCRVEGWSTRSSGVRPCSFAAVRARPSMQRPRPRAPRA
jgi:hypothetical protein